ncbi:MAG: type II secretion system F family protein, partial [Merismopediaceae bacterium]|nr:type II secretion system F family protein [Merismopediaceae bacterium]
MPTFVAQVKDSQGKTIKKKVEAMSPEQARTMLKQQYPAIGTIKPAGGEINLEFLENFLNKVTVKDKAVFSRQFSVMINAGVAIVRCLSVLGEQCPNPKLKKALVGISGEVQQGTNLSEAMGKFPECFDDLYVSMVEAGETGGVLDEVLNRLSQLLEDMARLQNQIKS